MSENLQISTTLANEQDANRRRVARSRVAKAYKYRDRMKPTKLYDNTRSLKSNYVNVMRLGETSRYCQGLLLNGVVPDYTIFEKQQNTGDFFSRSLETAEKFIPSNVERREEYTKAVAELLLNIEKVVQRRMLGRDFAEDAKQLSRVDKIGIYKLMGDSVNKVFQGCDGNITTLSTLSTRYLSYDEGFFTESNYKNRWSIDFRNLIDDSMKILFKTFGESDVSYLGKLIPQLREYVPPNYANTPPRRRPKGFIYKMGQNSSLLRIIFNIMMIRFPCINANNQDIWKSFTISIYLERSPDSVQRLQAEYGEENVVQTMYRTTVTFEYTDTSLQNLFYYIPEQERVVGIWPKTLRVGNGAHSRATVKVNYNCQMVRTVMCKIRLRQEDVDEGSKINFNMLFEEGDNFYTRIRKMDIFHFGSRIDPWARYYVNMTFFNSSSEKLLHVPWTIESTSSPFNGRNGNSDGNEYVPYDISELMRVIIEVLERRISGRLDENDDGSMVYVTIQFVTEHSVEHYQNLLHLLDELLEEDSEEDGIESKSERRRNVRRRVSRTPQQASLQPPTPSSTDSNILSGMLIGAPYAGTPREKHFLRGAMINRFTISEALFETPQRNRTYSCFMMSVIRCQMYMYTYNEVGTCTGVYATNAGHKDSSCDGKFVEAVMDYSNATCQYPFIKKLEGNYYIHLFNNTKYTENGKYMAGSRSEEENHFWEMAADEIWIHLERFRGREINYNDLGDYGQAFADFFYVCISVYDIEYRGKRICVISPYNKSPSELAQNGEILMIHVVFDQGHIHPINNLRKFIQSKKRASDVRITHYCPICDQKQTNALTSSRQSALDHITSCTKEKETFNTGFKKEEEYRYQSQLPQTRIQYRKVGQRFEKYWECLQCHQEVTQLTYQCHVCTIQKKKLEPIANEKLWVWDVEAAQMEDQFGLLKHECNCVYIRKVYTEDPIEMEGRHFPSEVEFVNALLEESEFQNSIFLAHNSGSYDIHFLLRIFERGELEHTYTPSPTSKHKFIMVQLIERNVKFLDFIRFMPGSLKGIAESFKVPVSKGDFPHRFNDGTNDNYVGRIPPLHGEKDYWNINESKSKKQKESFEKWYNDQLQIYCTCDLQCTCDKQKWDFQVEIKKYCLLDVVVLAEVVKAYRDKVMSYTSTVNRDFPDSDVTWEVPQIDPFQFMTLPQITMQTLIHGYRSNSFQGQGFNGIVSYYPTERESRCQEALLWLNRREVLDNCFILSRANSLREFYEFDLKLSFDGYCFETNTVYIFLKCSYWGCPVCLRELVETNSIIPSRGMSANDVRDNYEAVMLHMGTNYKVVSIWEHDFVSAFFNPHLLSCIRQMKPLDCFYGGRTEVFKLYCNGLQFPDEEIHYYDVTSLYPSVYAHCVLPIGSPTYIIGYNAEMARLDPSHRDPYFGYVRIRIRPPNTDRIGLLPRRDPQTQRLTFPVHPMEGCWFTEEVYLAIANGYVIEEVYEVYHWPWNQRSDQYLRGYVGFFLRMKQESEGWIKLGAMCDNPTPEEQERLADQLYVQNGNLARIRPECVKIDPVMRALAKLFLNSLWGKWAQKQSKNCHTTIYGQQQFSSLLGDRSIEMQSLMLRNISPGVFKVNYKKKDSFVSPVPHGNVFLAAAVTAWARITLHKQMLVIGASNLIYCDTDSIIFRWPKTGQNLSGIGLGKWTDEYPNNKIRKVYALAPKLYALELGPKDGSQEPGPQFESFRAKGIQMTLENQSRLGFDTILPLIRRTIEDKTAEHTINVKNFNIFTNSTNNALPFGNLFSRYNTKKVRVIITKRTIEEVDEVNFETLGEINTFPPGYGSKS